MKSGISGREMSFSPAVVVDGSFSRDLVGPEDPDDPDEGLGLMRIYRTAVQIFGTTAHRSRIANMFFKKYSIIKNLL